ncbi:MAG: YbhB/YbcL family Raf kinase inhibitor-like protein [Chlamydiota bacterium]
MELKSSAFTPSGKIPAKFSCDGENISPELLISGVPAEAKSLVLIMDDPDVPESVRQERMWDHWVVFNIPPETKRIPENTEPPGVGGKNTGGDLGYQGPCPPDREHRYFFKLYALDCKLDLAQGATKKEVEQAMEDHVLAETQLMGRYKRL